MPALVLALAGCAATPPVVAPVAAVDLPAAWSLPAPPGAPELQRWWAGLGDPLLTRLVDEALATSTELSSARAAVARARALRDSAAAALWLSLSVSGSAQRSRPSSGRTGNVFDAGLDGLWTPDVTGSARHGVAAAVLDAEAAAAQLRFTRSAVAAEVALDYLALRSAQARLAIATENLAAQEQTDRITGWRVQAGLASSLEQVQSRSAVAQTRAQRPALEHSAAQARHALAVLTGRPSATLDAELAAAAPLPAAPADLPLPLPADLLRRRADVQAAEAQWRAAAERVAQADALRGPALQLRASLGWTALTLGALGSQAAAASLIGSIGQTLFDAGSRDAQLAAQRAAFDTATEAYRARVLAAWQDAEDALSSQRAARQRLASLREASAAARDAAMLARQRHQGGLVDFQTVLDTQRTLLSVQDAVAATEAELLASHVRLVLALGGGEPSPPFPAQDSP